MSVETVLFIGVGTLAMWGLMLLCRRYFDFSVSKSLLLSVLLTVCGVAGVKIMFFIENGTWEGISFFGAVLLVPLFLYPAARLTKTGYGDYLDISAPCISVMLAVMKVNCLLTGCCRGKVLRIDANGAEIRFPSQLCEMAVALLIAAALILFIIARLLRHGLYPMFMILYGVTRFSLNLFRDTDRFWGELGIGNVWALVSTAIGLIWLIIAYLLQRKARRRESPSK